MWKYIIIVCAVLVSVIVFQRNRISNLKDDRDVYKANTETLLSDVRRYKINDSINVAEIDVLHLRLNEYKRLRNSDSKLISDLKSKNTSLDKVNKIQMRTITELKGVVSDTLIIRDTVEVAKKLSINDKWFKLDGIIVGDKFNGVYESRDSLVIVQYAKYKRFLGFLWKIKINEEVVKVASKNPNTRIDGFEVIKIIDK